MGFREDMAAARAQFDADMAEARAAGEPTPFFMRGVVDELSGVKLYKDRIEYKGESKPLAGVTARCVDEVIAKPVGIRPGSIRNVYLMITGPDFEWSVYCGTTPVVSVMKIRRFARRVDKTAP